MRIINLIVLICSLFACSKPDSDVLKIGTIAGPETELVEVAKEEAAKQYGLKIKIIEFNDYNLPNEALNEGSLDANVYQHIPFLKASMKAHGYKLQVIGKTFIYPVGIYSNKLKSLAELPEKAVIAIPNDPSNEARALSLLQQAGLIKLSSSNNVSLRDIVLNSKQFQFKELDAAQLPRALNDVDVAVINTTFAIPAGLSPLRDALYIEGKDSPYANIIVIRSNSDKKVKLQQFVKSMNSLAVRERANVLFGDSAIPAWN